MLSDVRNTRDDDDSREDLANYLNNMGLCFYHKGQDDDEEENMNDALDHFVQAIKANKKNPVHYFNKGNVHLSKN